MPRKRKKHPQIVELNCLSCGKKFRTGKLYSDPVKGIKVVCGGLKLHLQSKSFERCAAVHQEHITKTGDYDFQKCLPENYEHPSPPPKNCEQPSPTPFSKQKFTSEQFGLTMTDNGPAADGEPFVLGAPSRSSNKNMHGMLNSQTVHQGFQPPSVNRKTIIASLKTTATSNAINDVPVDNKDELLSLSSTNEFPGEGDNDDGFFGNKEHEESSVDFPFLPNKTLESDSVESIESVMDNINATENTTNSSTIKISLNTIFHEDLPVKLQVKKEPMQLMAHHKMLLVCFKKIFDLAMRSQKKRRV